MARLTTSYTNRGRTVENRPQGGRPPGRIRVQNEVMKSSPTMKKERYALALILLAFLSGMILTAAISGCDGTRPSVQRPL
ncbi:MAG: hypothetical protein D6753_03435 [Planctomycetota bacterium]|nr:MAG: hypothetical protein D6753_03435 [Planctomycetota bacterium]